MADWHLKDIAAAFERKGWRFVAELPQHECSVSAIWRFERAYDGAALEIAFPYDAQSRDPLPIEQAYCCKLVGECRVGLYFYSHKHTPSRRAQWRSELEAFIANAIAWATTRNQTESNGENRDETNSFSTGDGGGVEPVVLHD